MSELTAQQLAAKTRVSRAVLQAAHEVGGFLEDPNDFDGDPLFELAEEETDAVIRAFLKGFRNDEIHHVLSTAQRASEAEGWTLVGRTIEVETDRGQTKEMVFTRDHLFQLETAVGPAPELEAPSENGHEPEEKTINDVIADYSKLHAREIVEKMKTLSEEDIELIKEHELNGEERPNILNFVHNPADEETWEDGPVGAQPHIADPDFEKKWEGEPEESKEYEVEQEAPVDEDFAKDEAPTDIEEVLKRHGLDDYPRRRITSIKKILPDMTEAELIFFKGYEQGSKGRRRPELIGAINVELDSRYESEETEQVAEVPAEPEETREEQKERYRQERIEAQQQPSAPPLTISKGEDGTVTVSPSSFETVELPVIQPRQQGAIEQEELNQKVLSSLAHLGLPEPEIPSETPKLPPEVDNGILTEDMIHQQMMLFAANQGYATYHAEQYEAEEVAKKAMANKAAYELRKTIGVMTEDGKHKKLESQIDAEVETHPTVATYREEQKFAESAAKRLRGNAAFYGACERALSRILTTRQEQLKRRG